MRQAVGLWDMLDVGSVGQYKVSATVCGHHMVNSPVVCSVVNGRKIAFDPARCHEAITLSNDGRTATVNLTSGYYPGVCGIQRIVSGKATYRVEIDELWGDCSVCVSNATSPNLTYSYDQGGRLFGCSDAVGNKVHCKGSLISGDWRNGDVIRLEVDCDQHTLTGVHERTQCQETLSNVTGELYLFVILDGFRTQMSLLRE